MKKSKQRDRNIYSQRQYTFVGETVGTLVGLIEGDAVGAWLGTWTFDKKTKPVWDDEENKNNTTQISNYKVNIPSSVKL